MKNKISLTIGIPAHNEEANIEVMIQSVLRQNHQNYTLDRIIVFCDACTDETEKIVRNLSKKYSLIKLLSDRIQKGKAVRLNKLYEMNMSDILATLDADILLGTPNELDLLVINFIENSKLVLCTARNVPLEQTTLIGKISNVSYNLWQKAAQTYNFGKNIHTCLGSVVMLRDSFAKTVHYPKNTISDQGYIFIKAFQFGEIAYNFEHKSTIYFRAVNTFEDFMLQGSRAIFEDKQNMSQLLGENSRSYYVIPLKYKLSALIETFLSDPVFTLLSIGLGYYIRLFPNKRNKSKNGIWNIAKSSKKLINN